MAILVLLLFLLFVSVVAFVGRWLLDTLIGLGSEPYEGGEW